MHPMPPLARRQGQSRLLPTGCPPREEGDRLRTGASVMIFRAVAQGPSSEDQMRGGSAVWQQMCKMGFGQASNLASNHSGGTGSRVHELR